MVVEFLGYMFRIVAKPSTTSLEHLTGRPKARGRCQEEIGGHSPPRSWTRLTYWTVITVVPLTFVVGSVAVMVVVAFCGAVERTVAEPALTLDITCVLLDNHVTLLVMLFVAPPGE